MNSSEEILDSDFLENKKPGRRRSLLPWWMKFFCWVFLIFGAIVPLCTLAALLGYNFNISIYGLSSTGPLTLVGSLMMVLFLFKGITAYGLWYEKDWAITAGITDANIGIITCFFVMLGIPALNGEWNHFNFRLEILFLIPYLLKLIKIKNTWLEME